MFFVFVSIKDARPDIQIPPLEECDPVLDGGKGKSICYPFKQASMFNHLKCVCAKNIITDVSELEDVFLTAGIHMPNLLLNRGRQ